MSKGQMLVNLGNEIKNLCHVLYGQTCSPLEKVTELSARTGINQDLIQAALLAAESG